MSCCETEHCSAEISNTRTSRFRVCRTGHSTWLCKIAVVQLWPKRKHFLRRLSSDGAILQSIGAAGWRTRCNVHLVSATEIVLRHNSASISNSSLYESIRCCGSTGWLCRATMSSSAWTGRFEYTYVLESLCLPQALRTRRGTPAVTLARRECHPAVFLLFTF